MHNFKLRKGEIVSVKPHLTYEQLAAMKRECVPCRPLVKPIQVRSPSAGVGDHLMSLTIAEGLRLAYPECSIVFSCPAWAHQWVSLFGGYHRLAANPIAAPTCFCDNTGDWSTFTASGKSRWRWWGEKFGVKPTIPALKQFDAGEWPIPYTHAIVLSPFAAFKERTWPLERWLEVERILCQYGFRVVILDDKSDRCNRFVSEGKLLGKPAVQVTSVIRDALCFVGNDSGMAHVAGMLGVPSVAVASRVSDAGIMDLYPRTKTLGGKQIGMEAVNPDDVIHWILAKVNEASDGFPTERFTAALPERDLVHRYRWPPIYAVLRKIIHELQPRRIVEIGVRAGQSAWIMLDACPEATIHGIDKDKDEDGGYCGAVQHAVKILPPERFTLQIADSHILSEIPPCDLCYIDGDHSEEGCFMDLMLAERSGAARILVDDYVNQLSVREAVKRFVSRRPDRLGRFIQSQTGLYLIERRT